MAEALIQFTQQSGLQLAFRNEGSEDRPVSKVIGVYTPSAALDKLLAGSGLKYEFTNARTVLISDATAKSEISENKADVKRSDATGSAQEASQSMGDMGDAKDKLFRAAQAETSVGTSSSASMGATGAESVKLEEVIVSAQKRDERLQDVPLSVTVLNAETLAENGQNRLVDYFATVPGLSLNSGPSGGGTQYVTIRGISTGSAQNATVAVVVDDAPAASSSALTFGSITVPDIDPSDLARIEVLKGPQGTLYGADSLGGLIKYVTVDPSTAGYSGRVEVAGVDISEGGVGYAVRGAANIPLSDAFAIRASGFSRRDPGFVDNLTSGQGNVNSANVYGGHVAALWRPSDDLSLKVSALVEQTDGHGSPYFNAQVSANGTLQPTLGYLKQTGESFASPYTRQQQLYSATLKAKVSGLDLVSVTGYSVNKLQDWIDWAQSFDAFFPNFYQLNTTGVGQVNNFTQDIFTQELRLSSSAGRWLDWLVGAFYQNERAPVSNQTYYNANPATQAVSNELYTQIESPFTLTEYAVFGDVTVHLTNRFDVQLGGRESWNRQTYASEYRGPGAIDVYGVSSPYGFPEERATGNAFTYLVTPQFKISDNLMVYVRVASGYRIGGPNFGGTPQTPPDYKPDRSENYEIGIKGDVFEHRLNFAASAYYIAWRDFQIALGDPFYYVGNAGDAKSEGLELSVQTRPATGLTISAQGSYNDAALTQDLPKAVVDGGTYGLAGDPLPYSIRWSGGLSAQQDVSLTKNWRGFVGGTLTYTGLRQGEFVGPPPSIRAHFPGYATINANGGARTDSWLINVYVNNLADRRAVVGGNNFVYATGVTSGWYGTVIQPRTVGLSVSRSF